MSIPMLAVDSGWLCNLGSLPDNFLQSTIYFELWGIEFHSGFIATGSAAQAHDPEKHALGPRPDGCAAVFRKDHAQSRT
jgi:hypothetical protein